MGIGQNANLSKPRKTIPHSVRLTVDDYLLLKRRAWKLRVSMSDLIISKTFDRPLTGKYWRLRKQA